MKKNKDIITTESDGHVRVETRIGSFPWERFVIACVLVSVVWILALPQAIGFLPMADSIFESSYWPWLRFGGAPLFLVGYFLVTFHGFHVESDSFSYFMTFAFHWFDIEADSEFVVIRKHWLLRTETRKIPTDRVQRFEIDDGWFICRTDAGSIVICDGPPRSFIQEPLAALNRAITLN